MLRGMSTLDDTQMAQLRAALEARKAELLQELQEVQVSHLERVSSAGNEPQKAFATEADRVAQEMVRDAEARRDHDELVAVRAALQRMEEGSYGLCVDCGGEIGLARLQAFPAALRCIDCQGKHEAGVAR
jgi:DnaK suppressor protein